MKLVCSVNDRGNILEIKKVADLNVSIITIGCFQMKLVSSVNAMKKDDIFVISHQHNKK